MRLPSILFITAHASSSTETSNGSTEAALLFGVELSYPAVVLPKLDIVTVYQLLCRLHRRFIVGAVKVHGLLKMAVATDNVGSIIGHVMPPFDQAGAQYSLSPIDAENGR
jgi:hypothetical protein